MAVQLVKSGHGYVAITASWQDGAVVKAAGGFRYDGAGRWLTTDPRSARLLIEFAAPELKAELEAPLLPAEPRTLLRLVREGTGYAAIGGYDANPVIKAAGFRWNGEAWATDDVQVAAKLARFAPSPLREEIERTAAAMHEAAVLAIEASRATDADVSVPVPVGLSYLGYQKAGINFALRQLALPGITGVLIADDMGLGKTIQAIGLVNARDDIRRVLIVCPASLKLNWAREWRKWSVHGLSVELATSDCFPASDVVIVNYDIVHRVRAHIDAVAWDLLIADEAHVLKNSKAQRTAAVLGGALLPGKEDKAAAKVEGRKAAKARVAPIGARFRAFLTGTPILNRPIEMWTLIHACDPHGIGIDFMSYAKRYCNAYHNKFGWDMTGASHLDELQTKLRSRFMVRRLKADVLTELPPKRRQMIEFAANGATSAVSAEQKAAAALQAAVDRAAGEMAMAEAEGDAAAYRRAIQALKVARATAFTEMSKLRHATAVKKIPYCIEHIQQAVEVSGKVIVFAHHGDVITALKKQFGDAAVVITGQTDIRSRQAAVDAFQADPKVTVFLGNILAAGVGITLTAAAHVVFCELDWRPGIVTQAEDRAHRIGQTNSVLVQHLVFEGSIDADMAKRIIDKQDVIDRALDVNGAALPDADDSEIDGILAGTPDPEGDDERATRVAIAVAAADASAAAAEARNAARTSSNEGGKPRWQVAEEAREERWAAMDAEAALMTPEQIAAAHAGLRILAGLDGDHAQEANGQGFNKGDSHAGHALAQREALSPRQAAAARKMLRKYVRQVGADLVGRLG